LVETLQARKGQEDKFKVQPRIPYPAKLFFRHEGEGMTFFKRSKK
jgi:hypothetical protein